MKAYTYYKGEFKELHINRLGQLGTFSCPVPCGSQIYIGDSPWVTLNWYVMNSKNRMDAVPIEECNELRAAMLLQGIPFNEVP